MLTRVKPILIVSLFSASLFSVDAGAARILVPQSGDGCIIDLQGEIDRETPRLLTSVLSQHAINKRCDLRLHSTGGDLAAAIETGEIIRKFQLWTFIPEWGVCASACTFLFLGGVRRTALGKIGFHRPYSTRIVASEKEARTSYETANKMIRNYLNKMNIPDRLLSIMNSVPPGEIKWFAPLDQKDLETLKELLVYGEDPIWAEERDSRAAQGWGVSRQEYYLRQQRVSKICQSSDPTCHFDVMSGKR